MKWRRLFLIHKRDGIALTTLVVVMMVMIVGINYVKDSRYIEDLLKPDSTGITNPYHKPPRRWYSDIRGTEGELFPFDPNTADSTALLRLGLSPRQVRSIYRYRARGGVFSRPEDFARVWSITVGDYERLAPMIRIDTKYKEARLVMKDSIFRRDTLQRRAKMELGQKLELNRADTLELMRVPHIAEYFSWQIINYRNLLGGYVSLDQLDEIEDFPQEAKQFLTLDTTGVQHINVNRLSPKQLARHPYLNWYQARVIERYRRKFGKIDSLEQLKHEDAFTPEDLRRLKPYVAY